MRNSPTPDDLPLVRTSSSGSRSCAGSEDGVDRNRPSATAMPLYPAGCSSPVAANEQPKKPAAASVSLVQRLKILEERVATVGRLEAKLEHVERELMLAWSSVSGLASLPELMNVRKHAEGACLQASLRLMIQKKIEARPEIITSRRKRRARALTVDHVTTRQSVDQMLAMASLEAVGTRGVGGRVSGRFMRFSGHREALRMVGFSAADATSAMHKTFKRLNETTTTRLLMESQVDDAGSVWYILGRNEAEQTIDVAQRSVSIFDGSQEHTGVHATRSTVALATISGLPMEPPLTFRWSALGDAVRPAGGSDGDVVGRLTLSLPACVIEDDAMDRRSLL